MKQVRNAHYNEPQHLYAKNKLRGTLIDILKEQYDYVYEYFNTNLLAICGLVKGRSDP